jgi:aryl-alcohol dehydrogenase-like predicted oxidoreductase
LHQPDPRTPIEETLEALDELVREGKVLYLGSSNFAGWQIVDADWVARSGSTSRFISAQNRYSLLEREAEAEVVPACDHAGVGLLPYYPLANGLLTGKYRRGEPAAPGTRLSDRAAILDAANWDVIEPLEQLAKERGVTLLHIALGGLAAEPAVSSVIAGATTPEQVRANVEAGLWEPTTADLVAIEEITGPRSS